MTGIDIKAIEQRAWQSFFGDGRWELSFGLAFLFMGLMLVLPDGPQHWIAIVALVLVPGMTGYACRKFITEPRMGRVTFSQKRRLNMAGAVVFLVASVLFGMAAWITASTTYPEANTWLSNNWFLLLLIAKVVLVFAVIAYFLNYSGVFFIGLGLAGCFLANELIQAPLMFFIVGAAITTIGVGKLIVFIGKYPLVPAEEE